MRRVSKDFVTEELGREYRKSLKKLEETVMRNLPFFLAAPQACKILVLPPGINPNLPTMKAQSLNYWTTREVPLMGFEKAVDKGLRGNERNVAGNWRKRVFVM